MAASSSSWAVWLVIIVFLLACIGIIIWFAIDNSIPKERKLPQSTVISEVTPINT